MHSPLRVIVTCVRCIETCVCVCVFEFVLCVRVCPNVCSLCQKYPARLRTRGRAGNAINKEAGPSSGPNRGCGVGMRQGWYGRNRAVAQASLAVAACGLADDREFALAQGSNTNNLFSTPDFQLSLTLGEDC